LSDVTKNLFLKIGSQFDSSGTTQATKSIEGLATGTKKSAGDMALSLNQAMQAFDNLYAKLDRVSAFLVDNTIGAWVLFEKSMLAAKKTLDLQGDEFDKMSVQLLQLSARTGTAAEELAGIAGVAGQLGVSKENLMGVVEAVNMMAVAFDMSGEQAATAAAKITNVFGMGQTKESIIKFGDIVNELSDKTAASVQNIIGFLESFGGTAKAWNIPIEGAAALGATLSSLGQDAADAGTRLASGFQVMFQEGQLGRMSELLGKTKDELTAMASSDMLGLIKLISESIGGVSDNSAEAAIHLKNIFGQVGVKALQLVAQNWDMVLLNITRANNASGSMAKEFANVMASLSRQIQIFYNLISVIGKTIGAVIGKDIAPWIFLLNDLFFQLFEIIDSEDFGYKFFKSMGIEQYFVPVRVILARITEAIIGLTFAFGMLIGGAGAIMILPQIFILLKSSALIAFGVISSGFSFLFSVASGIFSLLFVQITGTGLLLTGAVIAAIAIIYLFGGEIFRVVSAAFSFVYSVLRDLVTIFIDSLSTIAEFLDFVLAGALNLIKSVMIIIGKAILIPMNFVLTQLRGLFLKVIGEIVGVVVEAIKKILNLMKLLPEFALEKLGIEQSTIDDTINMLDSFKSGIPVMVAESMKGDGPLTGIIESLEAINQFEIKSDFFQNILSSGVDLKNSMVEKFNAIKDFGVNAFDKISEKFKEVTDKAKGLGAEAFKPKTDSKSGYKMKQFEVNKDKQFKADEKKTKKASDMTKLGDRQRPGMTISEFSLESMREDDLERFAEMSSNSWYDRQRALEEIKKRQQFKALQEELQEKKKMEQQKANELEKKNKEADKPIKVKIEPTGEPILDQILNSLIVYVEGIRTCGD